MRGGQIILTHKRAPCAWKRATPYTLHPTPYTLGANACKTRAQAFSHSITQHTDGDRGPIGCDFLTHTRCGLVLPNVSVVAGTMRQPVLRMERRRARRGQRHSSTRRHLFGAHSATVHTRNLEHGNNAPEVLGLRRRRGGGEQAHSICRLPRKSFLVEGR